MNKAVSIIFMVGILVLGVGSIFAGTWWALGKVRALQREAAAEEAAAAEAAQKTEPLALPPTAEPEPEPEAAAPEPSEPAPTQPPAPPEPEALVEAHCKDAPAEDLTVEVQFFEPALVALHLEEYRIGLTSGKVPQPVERAGLPVLVYRRDRDQDALRLCLDLDGALVDRVAQRLRTPELASLGDGAWAVDASPGTDALLAPDLLQVTRPKGPLVALAPSDAVVSLADASRPGAVARAARDVADATDTTGGQGCFSELPLVWKDRAWQPLKAPPPDAAKELKAMRDAAVECRLGLLLALMDSVRERARLFGQRGPPPAVPPLLAETTRTFDGGKVQTHLSLEGQALPLLLPASDTVELEDADGALLRSVPWPAFQKAAGKRLHPLVLGGAKVKDLYQLDPGLTAQSFPPR